jgi:NAD(P)H-hydrate epimerase
MKPLLTRREAADHDRAAIASGVPGLVLMENAARGAADGIIARYAGPRLARPLVIGGVGMNGGDGWAVARHLLVRGHRPTALLVGPASRVLGDARINFDALGGLGVPIEACPTGEALARRIEDATLIVDGLFGTGLDRPLEGAAAEVVERMNTSRRPIVALDLPSGIAADTGRVLGAAVCAELTIAFGAVKRGLCQHPGVDHAGDVVLVDIGVPGPSVADAWAIDASDLDVEPRPRDAHKGTAGRVLVLSGSPGKTGAAVLCGLGALRTGAALVTLAARGARAALDAKVVEMMTAEIPEALEASVSTALAEAATRSACVLGPGVGIDAGARAYLERLALALPVPTVLDADALTAFAGRASALKEAIAPRVLTPHPGEAAQLLGVETAAVQADRYAAARTLSDASGAVVVLKGARTVVAAPGAALEVIMEGTPALATGGTGDVLAGMVAARLVHAPPRLAARQAALLHALAGARAARADRGLLAHEVADAVPDVLAGR